MKNLIATAALTLSLAAPAAANVTNINLFFALDNASAAERYVPETSTGNPGAAEEKFAKTNDSAAETIVLQERSRVSLETLQDIQAKFALSNDSAAERVAK